MQNKKYREWISNQRCLYCYKTPSVPHHERRIAHDAGIGKKPSDVYIVPLCGDCHRKRHDLGFFSFWIETESAEYINMFLRKKCLKQLAEFFYLH